MKEIEPYVHRNRVTTVIAIIKSTQAWGRAVQARGHDLAMNMVMDSLLPLDDKVRHCLLDIGDEFVNEYKLQLLCEDDEVDGLLQVIGDAARAGQAHASWNTVADIVRAVAVL